MCFHTKFGGCNSKNKPATPLRSLKWSRAWQRHFSRYTLQILWKVVFSWDLELVKIWLWYLKALLSNCIFSDFLSWTQPPPCRKIAIFLQGGGWVQERKSLKIQLLKSALRYHNQIFTSSRSHEKTTFHKIWRVYLEKWRCHALDHFKLLKGVAGLFFELHPPNFVWKHNFYRCTNDV